ncbi:MAG TPA: T9SS type A sorting domain-containing protein, partial [Bacteroidales bacterium]|nr:T9SS type A sorting domain-containing protein [Bacteroidales bacterium]
SCLYNPDYAATLLIDNPNLGNLNIRITDMSGKIIKTDIINIEEEQFTLNIDKSGISPGLYIFTVFNNFEFVTIKVVIH